MFGSADNLGAYTTTTDKLKGFPLKRADAILGDMGVQERSALCESDERAIATPYCPELSSGPL